jgi:hypothetical protein
MRDIHASSLRHNNSDAIRHLHCLHAIIRSIVERRTGCASLVGSEARVCCRHVRLGFALIVSRVNCTLRKWTGYVRESSGDNAHFLRLAEANESCPIF